MGALIEFPDSTRARRPAVWGLATNLVESEPTRRRRAVVRIGDLATLCLVAEVPTVGDLIHGETRAVVESVRVARDGIVHVSARALQRVPAADDSSSHSPRVTSVLADLRRRRIRRDSRPAR